MKGYRFYEDTRDPMAPVLALILDDDNLPLFEHPYLMSAYNQMGATSVSEGYLDGCRRISEVDRKALETARRALLATVAEE